MKNPDLYHKIFNTVEDIICIAALIFKDNIAQDYKILDINPAFENAFGISRKKSINLPASKVFKKNPPPLLEQYASAAISQHPIRFKTYIENTGKHFLFTFYPKKGRRLFCTATDISQYTSNETAIHHLEGRLISICANCKMVRTEENQWEPVETYISKHTKARFTHGICPDCLKILYPGYIK